MCNFMEFYDQVLLSFILGQCLESTTQGILM